MLERLGMIGVSWRDGGAEALAHYTLEEADTAPRLEAFCREHELAEAVYIATCNRVELIFVRSTETPRGDLRAAAFELFTGARAGAGEAERRLRAWDGEGAAEHLFLVTAALDSACLGEAEIGGQVRAAQQRAHDVGVCGPLLEIVFGEAFRVAARVRGETDLNSGRVSLAEIAVDLVREHLDKAPGEVALIGVSPMTERAAVSLAGAGIDLVCVNRSFARAAELAARFNARALSLDAFRADPPPLAALVSATGAPDAVLDAATVERLAAARTDGQVPLAIDMAVPPDVDPAACAQFDLPRRGMDDITAVAEANRSRRAEQAAAARVIVDEALAELNERLVERAFGPLMGVLQKRYQQTAREGVKRLLGKELKGLGEHERAAIEKWSQVLARRFAHIPCVGLRGLLRDAPDGAVDAFLGGLEPEFADELRASLEPRPLAPGDASGAVGDDGRVA